MVAATWSIEPAEVNAMFMKPKHYRLLSPLNKLDLTDPRKVENFLIRLRAVADCKGAFLPPISRADFRMHFNLVGHGFWENLDGWTEVEFFDNLYHHNPTSLFA